MLNLNFISSATQSHSKPALTFSQDLIQTDVNSRNLQNNFLVLAIERALLLKIYERGSAQYIKTLQMLISYR